MPDKNEKDKIPEVNFTDLPEEEKKELTKGFRSLQDVMKEAQAKLDKKNKKQS